jgi:hypothetical protein
MPSPFLLNLNKAAIAHHHSVTLQDTFRKIIFKFLGDINGTIKNFFLLNIYRLRLRM